MSLDVLKENTEWQETTKQWLGFNCMRGSFLLGEAEACEMISTHQEKGGARK